MDRILSQAVEGNTLGITILSFNFMAILCWNLVNLQFCPCPQGTIGWFSCDIRIQSHISFSDIGYTTTSVFVNICPLYWFFCHWGYWTRSSKVLCWTSDPYGTFIRGTVSLYMCKERGKEIILVDYLLQLQISLYMFKTNIFLYMCMEGRWKILLVY